MIFILEVEVYLWWKRWNSLIFLRGTTSTICGCQIPFGPTVFCKSTIIASCLVLSSFFFFSFTGRGHFDFFFFVFLYINHFFKTKVSFFLLMYISMMSSLGMLVTSLPSVIATFSVARCCLSLAGYRMEIVSWEQGSSLRWERKSPALLPPHKNMCLVYLITAQLRPKTNHLLAKCMSWHHATHFFPAQWVLSFLFHDSK